MANRRDDLARPRWGHDGGKFHVFGDRQRDGGAAGLDHCGRRAVRARGRLRSGDDGGVAPQSVVRNSSATRTAPPRGSKSDTRPFEDGARRGRRPEVRWMTVDLVANLVLRQLQKNAELQRHTAHLIAGCSPSLEVSDLAGRLEQWGPWMYSRRATRSCRMCSRR
jgi:hypothetical protein